MGTSELMRRYKHVVLQFVVTVSVREVYDYVTQTIRRWTGRQFSRLWKRLIVSGLHQGSNGCPFPPLSWFMTY